MIRIPDIDHDKAMHALGGAVMCSVTAAVCALFFSTAASALLGLVLASAVGAAKEWIYDARRSTVDKMDFVATVIGAAVVTLPMIVGSIF